MTIDEILRSPRMTLASMRPLPTTTVDGRTSAYLHAGQMFYSASAHDVTTILGSCVAVCMWDRAKGIGGLNHYMLPMTAADGQAGPRFGTYAIPHLIEALIALGASKARLEAKLFGGACVIHEFQKNVGNLGLRNIDLARRMLDAERIPIRFEDVGGQTGRKIVFRTDDGAATIRRL